ncbi:extracellular solute-binding protein [Fodinisporobacter ferrooxydans]|uniref:Extracellular solute-binding protein n=1 Tax=Fodinisporobacter ferrooxydans TaxID=2901836 RepID=A0ABY4CJV1_9BACL|nr:extracellular solute-binding protein [Alicyclobacillaceae bacterium MYW30-H2]
MKKWLVVGASSLFLAGTVLTGCGSAANSNQGAGKDQTASSGKPITINFYSVAGTDNYYKDILIPMFEKATHGKYHVNYGRGGWQEIVNKIKAQGNHVNIDVVASGIDGVPAGAKQGVWEQLIPKYSKEVRYDEMTDTAKAYVKEFDGYGAPVFTSLGGPVIIYNSDKVKNPPTTYAALKTWIEAHPNKFEYANIQSSGPGRGFYFGLIQSMGENMNNPNNLSKTYKYLSDINKYVNAYPSQTGDTLKALLDGTVDIIPHLPGWFASLYTEGQIPPNIKIATLKDAKQILDAQFYSIPKNLSPERKKAALAFIHFAESKEANAQIYSVFYMPSNKNASIDLLQPKEKETYMNGLKVMPAEFKNGNQIITPANNWTLFPQSDVLLKHYDLWQQKIQAKK